MASPKTSSLSKLNDKAFSDHHQEVLRTLNDLYIESQTVVSNLKKVRGLRSKVKRKISVPGLGDENTIIYRTHLEINSIRSRTINRREYEKTLMLIISTVEDYLLSYIRLVLRAHPARILKSIKGNNSQLNVDLSVLIKDGYENVLEREISSRLASASFAAPAEYTKYFNEILGDNLREDALKRYIELKASRDLIVHAQSHVNSIYLTKTGEDARAGLGELLPINVQYFDASLKTAKQICVSVYRIARRKYGSDVSVATVLGDKGFA